MRLIASTLLVLLISSYAYAQSSPYPPGMRLIVGGSGALARNTPSLNGTCGMPAHECTAADSVAPGVYGVVQNDPPVFDPGGFWWVNTSFETGVVGWVSGVPPYLNQLTPVQMAQGFSFKVVGDYLGPNLTAAKCINDGIQSDAILNLQAQQGGTGQTGTLACIWNTPSVGNHIAVITAVNTVGSAPSTEFQFSVTAQVVPQVPSAPTNLRIAPK